MNKAMIQIDEPLIYRTTTKAQSQYVIMYVKPRQASS